MEKDSDILSEKGKQLYDHWKSLKRRPGEQLPFWQDVSAANVSPILDVTWLLDYTPPQTFIVRYMGSSVIRFSGQDITGQDFIQARIAPDKRDYMLALYKTVYECCCGARLDRRVQVDKLEPMVMTTTFFPVASIHPKKWFLLGVSELTRSKFLPKSGGGEDFYSSELNQPEFIDIGFGKPDISEIDKRIVPYVELASS